MRTVILPLLGALILTPHIALAGVTEEQFQSTIDELQSTLHDPVLARYGKEILITGDYAKPYSDTSAGGSFYLLDGKWGVHVVGWVAKLPEVTQDALRIVYCHELGHHVEGRGAEVESDYFATSVCAPLVFSSKDPYAGSESVSAANRKMCALTPEPQYCERVMTAVDQANEVRATVWRWHNSYTEVEIEDALACRKKVLFEGLVGAANSGCKI